MKYNEGTMMRVRQSLYLEADDTSQDKVIESMSLDSVFERCMTWEGIIGFEGMIKGLIKDIYKVELLEAV